MTDQELRILEDTKVLVRKEIESLERELSDLKIQREGLNVENKKVFDENISLLNKIAKYRAEVKILSEEISSLIEKKDSISKDIENFRKESNETLLMIASKKQDTEFSIIQLNALKDKNKKEQDGLIMDKDSIEKDKILLRNKFNDLSIRENELLNKESSVKEMLGKIEEKELLIKSIEDSVKLRQESLDAYKKSIDSDSELIEEMKKESQHKLIVLNEKHKVLDNEIQKAASIRKGLELDKQDIQSEKDSVDKDKQFYFNRVKELDSREQQIRLTELRVQKLIKDKNLEKEIESLEKTVRGS